MKSMKVKKAVKRVITIKNGKKKGEERKTSQKGKYGLTEAQQEWLIKELHGECYLCRSGVPYNGKKESRLMSCRKHLQPEGTAAMLRKENCEGWELKEPGGENH